MPNTAITSLLRNGLTRMDGVRGDTFRYGSGYDATYVTIKGDKFYAEGKTEHLPLVMGYSEDEMSVALMDEIYAVSGSIPCYDEIPHGEWQKFADAVIERLKMNRKESDNA